jgi:cell division septation protein DedD
MANYKVALDAGHGGSDPGAVYNGRQEKDDTLDLTLAVGDILKKNGVDVFYTRTTDEYETPFKKATDANNSGADLFISIHRNSSETPNQYSGVESLVFNDTGLKAEVARNINNQLEDVGFKNLGVDVRKNLVVLKRTKMPAVLVEAGFINNDKDNYLFDQEFDKIANAIADGILESIPASERGSGQSSNNNQRNGSTSSSMTGAASISDSATTAMSMENAENVADISPVNTSMEAANSTPVSSFPDDFNYSSKSTYTNNSGYYSNTGSMTAPANSSAAISGYNNMPQSSHAASFNISNADNNTYTNSYPYNQCQCNDNYTPETLYRVQTGAYRNKENADRMLNSLLMDGFPAFIIYQDGYYKVQVGAYTLLSNAIKMEQRLRRFHYSTYITT